MEKPITLGGSCSPENDHFSWQCRENKCRTCGAELRAATDEEFEWATEEWEAQSTPENMKVCTGCGLYSVFAYD
jgi:uncharacterized protein with PIN domain